MRELYDEREPLNICVKGVDNLLFNVLLFLLPFSLGDGDENVSMNLRRL